MGTPETAGVTVNHSESSAFASRHESPMKKPPVQSSRRLQMMERIARPELSEPADRGLPQPVQ